MNAFGIALVWCVVQVTLVGLLAGLVEEVGLAKVEQHAFGAGGDQRTPGCDQLRT